MSTFLKPSLYSGHSLENQYVNAVYTVHDVLCGCLKPIEHLNDIIKRQECRPIKDAATATTTTGEETTGTPDVLENGDLDLLFAEQEDDENR